MDGRLPARTDLSFQDRLKYAHLRLFHEIDDERKIEEVIGRSEKQMARYTAGADMPVSVLLKLSEWSRVPVEWILENELKTTNAYALPAVSDNAGNDLSDFTLIPFLDVRASAGPGALITGAGGPPERFLAFEKGWLRRIGVSPRHAEVLIATGDSMEPTIRDGDVLLVDRSIDRIVSEGLYVVVYGDLVLLKRVQQRRDRTVVLMSDNPRYEPETVPADEIDQITVAGRVRWFGRTI